MTRFGIFVLVVGVGLLSARAIAQHPQSQDPKVQQAERAQEAKTQATSILGSETSSMPGDIAAQSGKKKVARSNAWKIQNATTAAPRSIAKGAAVMDWPVTEGGEMPVLRKGTNDWTCLPDDPTTPSNDPNCMDKMAVEWAKAWMSHGTPNLTSPGIGYMLQGGGSASNTDPFAKKPAAGETWMKEPPHLMIFPATGTKLDPNVYGDMHSGGPWIMWGGTPYEHLMVPVK
jgi:hypothetical protein